MGAKSFSKSRPQFGLLILEFSAGVTECVVAIVTVQRDARHLTFPRVAIEALLTVDADFHYRQACRDSRTRRKSVEICCPDRRD